MQCWKVKLKPVEPFEEKPTRRTALKALNHVRHKPTETWGLAAIVGHYFECYERKFRRRWPLSATSTRVTVLEDLRTFRKRVGSAEAVAAITMVFTKRFNWVQRHSAVLVNDRIYGTSIVAALHEREASLVERESEWSGSREGKPREVSAEEFFG